MNFNFTAAPHLGAVVLLPGALGWVNHFAHVCWKAARWIVLALLSALAQWWAWLGAAAWATRPPPCKERPSVLTLDMEAGNFVLIERREGRARVWDDVLLGAPLEDLDWICYSTTPDGSGFAWVCARCTPANAASSEGTMQAGALPQECSSPT